MEKVETTLHCRDTGTDFQQIRQITCGEALKNDQVLGK